MHWRAKLLAATFLLGAVACSAVNVGYTQNPPQIYRRSDGKPGGFLYDVFTEAARREHFNFQWVFVDPAAAQQGLSRTDIDIWPAGVTTAERLRRFYITSPWWRTDLVILTMLPIDTLDGLNGRRVAYTSELESVVRERLPNSTAVRTDTHFDSAVSLCRGTVDALVTDHIILDQLLLNRPPACVGINLGALGLPGATLDLSVLARPEVRADADRLRKVLGQMEDDGTIAAIALKYPAISSASAGFIATMLENNQRYAKLRISLILACVLLGVSALLLYWLAADVRRRKLTESDLRNSNAELEQFNYAASHDLAEPLRNISLYSEMLERRASAHLPDESRQYLKVINDGARRMQRLLEGLRQYTQMGRSPKAVGAALPMEILEEVRSNLSQEIAASLAVITAEEMPPVRIEQSQLLQLLQNFVSNALKYRGTEPPRIHITALRDRDEVLFCIRDNGIGIAPEYHDRIFGIFKRLHGAEIPGTGVGLAICKRIVERSGGRIWVDSQPGKGSRFFFTLPAKAPAN